MCVQALSLQRTILGSDRPILTDVERVAHYRDMAGQFRKWAEAETREQSRIGLLDMARQYERLATQLGSRPTASLANRP
jgi:hypothetical protein